MAIHFESRLLLIGRLKISWFNQISWNSTHQSLQTFYPW